MLITPPEQTSSATSKLTLRAGVLSLVLRAGVRFPRAEYIFALPQPPNSARTFSSRRLVARMPSGSLSLPPSYSMPTRP